MGTTRYHLKWPRANLSARARTTINLRQGPQITCPWVLLCSYLPAQACHHCTASHPRPDPAPLTHTILILIFIILTLITSTATMSSSICPCMTASSTPWRPAWWTLAPNNLDGVTAHEQCVKRPFNSWNQRRQPCVHFPTVIQKIRFVAGLSLLKCYVLGHRVVLQNQ